VSKTAHTLAETTARGAIFEPRAVSVVAVLN
jgi:hypothetical protein